MQSKFWGVPFHEIWHNEFFAHGSESFVWRAKVPDSETFLKRTFVFMEHSLSKKEISQELSLLKNDNSSELSLLLFGFCSLSIDAYCTDIIVTTVILELSACCY